MITKIQSPELFAITFASKLASRATDPKLESTAAIGTLLFGTPSKAYIQAWDDAARVTHLIPMVPLAEHQFSRVPSTQNAPAKGDPYLAAWVHEKNGELTSFLACDWDLLAMLLCSDPTYTGLRRGVLHDGVDGYHVSRFLGTLAPGYASAEESRFDVREFAGEIYEMSLLERARAKKNPSWVQSDPSKTMPPFKKPDAGPMDMSA